MTLPLLAEAHDRPARATTEDTEFDAKLEFDGMKA
jgi:hypothetical protein